MQKAQQAYVVELLAEIKKVQGVLQKLHAELHDVRKDCKHVAVKLGDSAVCDICGDQLGWWCPKGERHYCDYPFSDKCVWCGAPEERK